MQTLHHCRNTERKDATKSSAKQGSPILAKQVSLELINVLSYECQERHRVSIKYCPICVYIFFKKELLVKVFPLKTLNRSFIVCIKASWSSQFRFHYSTVNHNKNGQQSQADRQCLQSTSSLLPWELQSHPGAERRFRGDRSRRVCFPVWAIPRCVPELLWRNEHIQTETLLCISRFTHHRQIKSPLYFQFKLISLFRWNADSACTASSSGHQFFLQKSYQHHAKSIFLMKLAAQSMKLLATETHLQTSVSSKSVLMMIFLFVCFAAISLLSHFGVLQKKCLTSDNGDHSQHHITPLCTAGLF